MATLRELESQSPETLYEFFRWLAFGLGRHLGIATTPHYTGGLVAERIHSLAQHLLDAPRRTSDEELGIQPPKIFEDSCDAEIVRAFSDYLLERHVACFRNAEDFHADDALAAQREALARAIAKYSQSAS